MYTTDTADTTGHAMPLNYRQVVPPADIRRDICIMENMAKYSGAKVTLVVGFKKSRFDAAINNASLDRTYDLLHSIEKTIDNLRAIRDQIRPLIRQNLEDEHERDPSPANTRAYPLPDCRRPILSSGNSLGFEGDVDGDLEERRPKGNQRSGNGVHVMD